MQQLSCDQQFSKSVEEFVNRVKDPKKFISELTELIVLSHYLVKEDETIDKDSLFELSLVIPHVATPLIQGGSDTIENVKKGIIELADAFDARVFDNVLRLVLIAISKHNGVMLDRSEFDAFLILCDLSKCIFICEEEVLKRKAA